MPISCHCCHSAPGTLARGAAACAMCAPLLPALQSWSSSPGKATTWGARKISQSSPEAAVCPPAPLLTHYLSSLPPPVAPQTRLAAPRRGADLLSHYPCGDINPTHPLSGLKITLNDKTSLLQGLLISSCPICLPPAGCSILLSCEAL